MNERSDKSSVVPGDSGHRFNETYSKMRDEDILRLADEKASLREEPRRALDSELRKRNLHASFINSGLTSEASQAFDIAEMRARPSRLRILWIPAWYLALLTYNLWSQPSQPPDKHTLHILAEAAGRLTTPLELLLTAAVIYATLNTGRAPTDGHQSLRKRVLSHPAIQTVLIIIGSVMFLTVVFMAIGSLQGARTLQPNSQLSQPQPQVSQPPLNTGALKDYEFMSNSNLNMGNEADGISPATKKRMRETLALELAGAMQKQNNPLRIELTGKEHAILSMELPSMDKESSDELIQKLNEGDANFWNAMRLMNFSQVVFSGDRYNRIITRDEFLQYGKDYEKYKADFLKSLKSLQAGAQGEIAKP